MQVTQKCIIKGAGFFQGNVEGVEHDTGQFFIEEPFDPSKENYKGFRTVEYKALDSSIPKSVMHLQFPITAEVTMEISASKRGQVIVCTNVKPLGQANPQPTVKPAA